MTQKDEKISKAQRPTRKPSVLDRLNLSPLPSEQKGKTDAKESSKDPGDKWLATRKPNGDFGLGNPGGPGRPRGVKSLRKMIKEKGAVIVEQDPRKRTFAQLLVDRLWMNAVAGSERAITMVVESVDGPLLPPEPPAKPVEIYKVVFEGTTIINRRDEAAEDSMIERATKFIDVPFSEGVGNE